MKLFVKYLILSVFLPSIAFSNTCTLSNGTYANLAATAGNWLGTGCTSGGYVPSSPDIVVFPSSGTDLTLASGDFWHIGSTNPVGIAFNMGFGVSNVQYSTFTLLHGATMQLDGVDIFSNKLGYVNQYQHFNMAGTMLGNVGQNDDYGSIFICNGICHIIGLSTTTPAILSIPDNLKKWDKPGTFSTTWGIANTYYMGGHIHGANVFDKSGAGYFIGNATHDGPSVWNNSSLSFSGVSCSPSCAGIEPLQTQVASMDLVISTGTYYFDPRSGIAWFYSDITDPNVGPSVTFTDTFTYVDNPKWSLTTYDGTVIQRPYSEIIVQNAEFDYMGTTGAAIYSPLNLSNKLSTLAGGTKEGITVQNSVFRYCGRSISFTGNTATAGDPFDISGNDFWSNRLDLSGGFAGMFLTGDDSYINFHNNVIEGAQYFLFNTDGVWTGFDIYNNIFYGSAIIQGRWYHYVPDSLFDGNVVIGYGDAEGDNRTIHQLTGLPGHPMTTSNNVFLHGMRWYNIESDNVITGNVMMGYTHHGMMGPVESGPYESNVVVTNNIIANLPNITSDGLNLGYNVSEYVHNVNVSHNTLYNIQSGYGSGDLGGDRYDNGGNIFKDNEIYHSNLIVGNSIGAVRGADTITYASRLHFLVNGWNDVFNNTVSSQGWHQYSTVVGTTNVTGVSLFDPSTSLPLSGKTLTFTNTSIINKTLAWDGGSPVQLFLGSGTVSAADFQSITDSSANYSGYGSYTTSGNPVSAWIVITGGKDAGDIQPTVFNTATQIFIPYIYHFPNPTVSWVVQPDTTSTYALYLSEVVMTATGGSTIHAGIYWPSLPGSTQSDTNISITTNSYAIDPQFANPAVSLSGWDTSMGGPGTETHAGQLLTANPSLGKSSLLPYLQAGFKPQNVLISTAAYDHTTIGAIQFSTSALTLTGPPTCQTGSTCAMIGIGGTPPYTWSLVSGSTGTIDSVGRYSSPSHIAPNQVMNGCQAGPNNSVWNVPIDSLPVISSSTLWMSNIPANTVHLEAGMRIDNYPLSTDTPESMHFYYTPTQNQNFVYPDTYTRLSEGGTMNGLLAGQDNHYLVTYRDNCMQQENYQKYPVGINTGDLTANSQSGILYPLERFDKPGFGTDAAQLPISVLQIHNSELRAAEAGDVNAIKHATRMTMNAGAINAGGNLWPSPFGSGSVQCMGGAQPAGNCIPYGARLRLKSGYSYPGFDGICTTTGCHNIVNAFIQQQKKYGVFLADVGTQWTMDWDGGAVNGLDVNSALREIQNTVLASSTTYEVVDESSLQTSSAGITVDPNWTEVKVTNPYVTPLDAAVIQLVDTAHSTVTFSVALQGIGIGIQNQTEVVMAGSGSIQFSPWVTGSANTGFTCSLSPSGGSTGTITSGCLFTPASSTTVVGRSEGVVTVTASADGLAISTFSVVTLPVDNTGALYIGLGKAFQAGDYMDGAGHLWFNDMLYGHPVFFGDNNAGANGHTGFSGTNTGTAPSLYQNGFLASGDDMHFYIHVPNGNYKADLFISQFDSGTGQSAFSLDCNSSSILGYTDTWPTTGNVSQGTGDISCTQTVSNGVFHIAFRYQGVNPQSFAGFNVPLYQAPSNPPFLAGLIVSPTSAPPPPAGNNNVTITGKAAIKGSVLIQ